jgi:divalent metal cation (Fe/Co/Zn/Cd) transporter
MNQSDITGEKKITTEEAKQILVDEAYSRANHPGGFSLIIVITVVLAVFALSIVYYVTLQDVVSRKFKNPNDKMMWMMILLLVPVIGLGLYHSSEEKTKTLKRKKQK